MISRARGLRAVLVACAAVGFSATAAAQVPAGLVAAYGFEETSGTTTAADASGKGNVGTVSGATRTTSGKYGSALQFDGVNDIVNVADAATLDLTTGMTLEAWVNPTALSGYRTVVMKEVTGELSYTLYANDDAPAMPSGYVRIGSTSQRVGGGAGLPLNTWTHLATTYDGATLRLYVNGVQAGSQAVTGSIAISTRPMHIGGNTIWGEYFAGRIDEVRVYNRALTASEIAADMANAIVPSTPKVTITSPTNGATLSGTNVSVGYSTNGDMSQVAFVAVRLDSATPVMVSPGAPVQLTTVPAGPHTLNAWLARADQSKITGSDATAVSFTLTAPAGPKLSFTAPANGASIVGTTVNASYSTSGDLSQASHLRVSLDGGPEMVVMQFAGQLQLTSVPAGSHTLTGYVARADNSKIAGSDASPISFTTSAGSATTLAITTPANNATVIGSTVNVTFAAGGDLTGATHVHLRVDNGPEIMIMSLSGSTQITNVLAGAHTLNGYVARADHSKIAGSDAATVNFTVSIPNPNDPAVIGQWSNQIIDLPTVAVDLVMMHTGKAILWAGDFATAPNYGEVWNPANNQITPAPNPFSNIFCSSHVHLADGRVLVAGGHDAAHGIMGIADSNTFDPVTETWSSLPDMAFRRWYPTLTFLGDGRAIIVSGSENSETSFVEIPEVYDPVANTWTRLNGAQRSIPQYPMNFLLPDGRLLETGSVETPTSTIALNIATQQWSTVDARVLEGGSAIQYAPGKIMKSGSASNDGLTPNALSTATTYVIDMNDAAPAWRSTAPMAFPRTYHNLTGLPDGSVLVTSGTRRKNETDLAPAVLEAELWSPQSETWTTMGAMQTRRIYHSTAVLLPDARVAVSGSGNIAGGTDQTNLEIYSPPYLFRGPRPVITAAPVQLKYGAKFVVQTPNAADVRAVNLIRPGASTHSFDQDQRFVPLTFSQVAGGVEVQATVNANLAPPGYYMLFLINSAGVPSVAKFVRFPAPYEDAEPPTAPGNLAGSGAVGGATLSWQPSTDNVGVVRYEIHRSTVAGFTPSAATLIGQSTTTSFSDVGVGAGTYYYVVVAVDAAGSTSLASNQLSVTVLPDTAAPSVAISSPANGASVSSVVSIAATATDNVAVAGVQFKLDGTALGPEDTSAPYTVSWNTTTASNGPHVLTAVARDGSNNSTTSAGINVTVANSQQVPTGLVAYYSFEEGTGTTTADGSGKGNVGTVSGATWTTAGKSGKALQFDGTNDIVNVADAATLDLTTGMTLEAWVNPTDLSGWRTVVMKEVTGELSYMLYANDDTPAMPAGYVRIGSTSRRVGGGSGIALNTWTHLATTYDGATLRLYVNGVQAGTQAVTGSIATSNLPLSIGGNTVWGEYFAGRIDEVRVYNRALSATEIAVDMASGSTPLPRLAITAPANGATLSGTSVNISYTTTGDTSAVTFVAVQLDASAPLLVSSGAPLQLTNVAAGSHTLNGWLAKSDQSKIAGSDATPVSFTLTALAGPKLSFTAPANGANIVGTTVNVSYSTSGDLSEASHAHVTLDGGAEMMVMQLSGQLQLESVNSGSHALNGYVARADHSKISGSDATQVQFTTTLPDSVKPTVVLVTPRDGDTVTGTVSITATATDNVSVAGVQFKLDGTALGAEDTAAPYAFSWNSAAVANGTHVLTAVARDSSNNTRESIAINVIVSNAQQVPAGLVAAYGFDEGTGATVGDSSGKGNVGTVAGATWTTSAKSGSALQFDGVNDIVNVADAATLDLTTGMTLEAWVYPTALSGWRTVVMKEVTGELSYTLYANDNTPTTPAGYVRIGSTSHRVGSGAALPLNTWTHLATTYDGANMRLYVNGVQAGTQALTGSISASNLPLRIGGNTVWGEYFAGRIDEVRVYNRALSAAEVQSAMNTPVAGATAMQPTRSTPITVDAQARRVWTVNPDTDTVTALNADTLAVQFEITVGKHPTSIARDGSGQVWVTCRDDDTIWVLDAANGAVRRTLNAGWGSAPASIVFTPAGDTGYVALEARGQVQRVAPATQTLGPTLALGTTPRALAITADGKRLLVAQFISSGNAGTVRSVDLTTFAAGAALSLALDTTSQDGSLAARGLPNYLAGLAIDPADRIAWVVGKKDNIVRGQLRDAQPLTFETTLRAMVGRLDLNLNQEQLNRRLDLDNSSQPSAVALSDSGAYAFVTVQGNNRVVVLNQLGTEIVRADTGLAPQGVAIDPVTKRVFTQNLMGRTVSVFDGARLLNQGLAELPLLAQVRTIAVDKLSAAALQGKQIFYNAADPRMSRDGYVSCAACHLDGEHDGEVWDFTDRGEGLRNTITLRGQGGSAGAPLHWSGNFDEVQDFENDMRSFFGGSGFMDDASFQSGTRSQPLGDPKAGFSIELDALAAYVNSLTSAGRSPRRNADGTQTAAALSGKVLFQTLNCTGCHSGQRLSDSAPGVRHDVGTIKPSSGKRAGATLDGLDTPMLLGLWASAPYLHDGSAQTLRDVLTTANPNKRHGDLSALTQTQIDQLVEYLQQLETGP